MELKFSEIKIEDYQQVKVICKEMLDKHIKGRPDIYKEANPLDDDYFMSLLEDGDTLTIKGSIDDRVVAISIIELKKSPRNPIVQRRHIAFIDTFGVLKEYQNKGIGQQLFNKTLEVAKMMNVDSLELLVWEFNEQAKSFYIKQGMITLNRTLELKL